MSKKNRHSNPHQRDKAGRIWIIRCERQDCDNWDFLRVPSSQPPLTYKQAAHIFRTWDKPRWIDVEQKFDGTTETIKICPLCAARALGVPT